MPVKQNPKAVVVLVLVAETRSYRSVLTITLQTL